MDVLLREQKVVCRYSQTNQQHQTFAGKEQKKCKTLFQNCSSIFFISIDNVCLGTFM